MNIKTGKKRELICELIHQNIYYICRVYTNMVGRISGCMEQDHWVVCLKSWLQEARVIMEVILMKTVAYCLLMKVQKPLTID